MSSASRAPTWDLLKFSLVELLSKYNLDLEPIGTTNRLPYKLLEAIIYHLFLIIGSLECKKKLKTIYPARDSQDQARFIDHTVAFINSKKLINEHLTSSQLSCCGGEQFRRILGQLIVVAIDVEANKILRNSAGEINLQEIPKLTYEQVDERIEGMQKQVTIIGKELRDGELILDRLESLKGRTGDLSQAKMSKNELLLKIKELISSISATSSKLREQVDRIKFERNAIKRRRDRAESLRLEHEPKRISQIIREVQECDIVPKFCVNFKVLEEFDLNLDKLLGELKVQILDIPEVARNYKFLTTKIPLIKLKNPLDTVFSF